MKIGGEDKMEGWYIDTTIIIIIIIIMTIRTLLNSIHLPFPTILYTLIHIPSVMELKSFFGRPVDDGVAKESLSDRVRTSMGPAAVGGLNSIRLFLCCVIDKWDS